MAHPEHSSENTVTAPAGTGSASALAAPPRRSEAQRAEHSRALAELTERAREIAARASTAIVAAFKDVAADPAVAAELSVESTRDLAQYLQRRGQLTTEDAERLIRSAESAAQRRPGKSAKPPASKPPTSKPAASKSATAKPANTATKATAKPAAKKPTAARKAPAPKKSSSSPGSAAKGKARKPKR